MEDTFDNLACVPDLSGKDVETLLCVLVGESMRVQKVVLSSRTVWIKRYGTEKPMWWRYLQELLASLIPAPCLRPSPCLLPAEMAERERRRMELFSLRGFATPDVLHASHGIMVLADVGMTVQARLRQLKCCDPATHDDLLVACANELGRLHAAGLCHGRPYPRDMFFAGNRIGFMDFEEEPQAVMPLAVAQARDIWLLFLQIASNAKLGRETFDRCYAGWAGQASPAAIAQLGCMIDFLGRFLSLARLIGRVRMGSDLRRFIVATDYLMTVGPEIDETQAIQYQRPQGRTT